MIKLTKYYKVKLAFINGVLKLNPFKLITIPMVSRGASKDLTELTCEVVSYSRCIESYKANNNILNDDYLDTLNSKTYLLVTYIKDMCMAMNYLEFLASIGKFNEFTEYLNNLVNLLRAEFNKHPELLEYYNTCNENIKNILLSIGKI